MKHALNAAAVLAGLLLTPLLDAQESTPPTVQGQTPSEATHKATKKAKQKSKEATEKAKKTQKGVKKEKKKTEKELKNTGEELKKGATTPSQ